MRHLKSTLRLLVATLFAFALWAPSLPSLTIVAADVGRPSAVADDDDDDDSDDDDDDDDERGGRRDPCRRALKRAAKGKALPLRCAGGSSSGIARGDFNGDGVGDLAVGVPFEDVADAKGVVAQDAGGVNVIYGSAAGLDAAAGPGDQLLVYTRANGRAGSALAAGDFNGDGFSDLAVGAPFDDAPQRVFSDGSVRPVPFTITDGTSNTILISEATPPRHVTDAGLVHVFYGSPAGLNLDTWESLSLSFIRITPRTSDEFGAALAWGDFDDDGFGDLAVGVPGYNLQAGAVVAFYGSGAGLRSTAFQRLPQFWTQDSTNIIDGSEAGDRFGATLAGGAFGLTSGATDLAVGVPGEDLTVQVGRGTANVRDAGAVHVIYGNVSGLSAEGNQFWSQDSRQFQDGGGGVEIADAAEEDDRFGSALASFGLGGSDLAVGVPGEDVGTIVDAGAVNVIYFDPAANKLSFPNNQLWTQDSADVEDAAEPGDHFGFALAGGDFNGDTLKDLAVGAPGETLGDQAGPLSNAGAVHVIYYQSFGVGLSATAGPGDQFWTQDSADILDSAAEGERFGSALTAWDFGKGFLADLAVGVPFQSVSGFAGAGAVNVIYGDNTTFIPALRAAGNQFWTQESPGVEGTAEAGDQFGRALY